MILSCILKSTSLVSFKPVKISCDNMGLSGKGSKDKPFFITLTVLRKKIQKKTAYQ